MKLIKVTPCDRGNVRAVVEIEGPTGEVLHCQIVKQPEHRAYLATCGHQFTHKEKRQLQRAAVTAWANQIGNEISGLLESEKAFRGSRLNRLGATLQVFCPVCDRNTPSEFSATPGGAIRNACYFCGTLRKGKPNIGADEVQRIREKIDILKSNACQGTRGSDENRMD